MENTTTPAIIWEVKSPSMIAIHLEFISIHPKNPRYAFYLDSHSQEPIRVYIPNLFETHHETEIKALEKAEYTTERRLENIRERKRVVERNLSQPAL